MGLTCYRSGDISHKLASQYICKAFLDVFIAYVHIFCESHIYFKMNIVVDL